MRIALIGAGRMGRPILDRLVGAGHDVTTYARRPEMRAELEAAGITCADSIMECVRGAQAVFVVVLNDEQVREVCLGTEGALTAMQPGAVLVQHTTCDPETVSEIAAAGDERDVGVLDAALSGAPGDILAGHLTLWVAGNPAVLQSAQPLLCTYADPVLYIGERAGNGQRVKLVNNSLFVAQVGLAVEAVRIAADLGIGQQEILTALQHGSAASRALAIVAGIGAVERVGDQLADLMRKDVAVVQTVAHRAGTDLGVVGTVIDSEVVQTVVLRNEQTRRP